MDSVLDFSTADTVNIGLATPAIDPEAQALASVCTTPSHRTYPGDPDIRHLEPSRRWLERIDRVRSEP